MSAAPAVALRSSTGFPVKDAAVNAERICETLEKGRETERIYVEGLLADPKIPVNRAIVREYIFKMMASRYKPEPQPQDDEAEKLRAANTRGWFLYVLPLVAENDPNATAVMRQALAAVTEPNPWVRYWALVGRFRYGSTGLAPTVVAQVITEGGDDLVVMLAHAVAANAGDAVSLETLRQGLLHASEGRQWAVLRAIRIVRFEDGEIIRKLCGIVDKGENSDITYDSIQALKNIRPDSDYSKLATRTLGNFVDRWSTYPARDAMRLRALVGLGRLRRSSEAQIQIEQ